MNSGKQGLADTSCHECGRSGTETRLHKCPICYKEFCEDHARQRSGLWFCCKGCSEYFFYSESDD